MIRRPAVVALLAVVLVLGVGYFSGLLWLVPLVSWLAVVALFVWGMWLSYTYEARKSRARSAKPRPALPVDDGPLDYDGSTYPTPGDVRAYSFGGELLAPVRERLVP